MYAKCIHPKQDKERLGSRYNIDRNNFFKHLRSVNKELKNR